MHLQTLDDSVSISTTVRRGRRDLIALLNYLVHVEDAEDPQGRPVKAPWLQIYDAVNSIVDKARVDRRAEPLGVRPCLISTHSVDSRGRAQRSIRFQGRKIHFRPWHLVWIANNGPAPAGLQYSHRCHQRNCVEPDHGVWETDLQNKSRNRCANASHVFLPDGKKIVLCDHDPCCLSPLVLAAGDPRIICPGGDGSGA